MDMARVRDLIEALVESQPILAEDSTFLRRALVVGGVNSLISPVHLESFFTRYGAVMATVLLRDAARGERIGMLVFFAESDCLEAAESEAARPGAYRTISRVDDEILHNSVELVKDAADQQSRRSSTAEAFRRMVPWRYLEADAQEDINLRCLLLRMGARSTATPGYLYGVARSELAASGRACAVVAYYSSRMAMVVFDESRDIERCGSRSAELVAFHLGLYDSGLFPLVADGAGGHGVVTRDLLPLFCLSPDFLGRVVLLRGPGIAELDAGEACRRVEELHPVEALLVHRGDRLAVVVVRSRGDARALMAESGEFWRRACGPHPITAQLIDDPSPAFMPRPLLYPEVVNLAVARAHRRMDRCTLDDLHGLGRGLVELESLRPSSSVRQGNLARRGFILLGLHQDMTEDYLMQYFGDVESCVVYMAKRAALVIFSTPEAAARALRTPMADGRSRDTPRDDQVVDYLLLLQYTMLRVDDPLAHEDAQPLIPANYVLPP
uniref:RRM domain-containing protein n=1 Tax=Oryza glaberrima TaxID=4538 RepID=I1QCF6_ORYGL